MKAYLHFGGAFTKQPNGPFLTEETEAIYAPLWWQVRGLSYTASGYGGKMPSNYKVKHGNRWKRVYIAQYSNAGTAYILEGGKPVATVDIYTP